MVENKSKSKKIKVTLSIDREIWVEFQIFCMYKYKGVKHASRAIEELMKEQIHHGKEKAISVASSEIKLDITEDKSITTKRKS